MSWILRTATAEDISAIMQLEEEIFPLDSWSQSSMLAELTSPWTEYFIAHPEGQPSTVAGFAGLYLPRSLQADIQTIGVGQHFQGQGIGTLLLQHLLFITRQRGYRDVLLEVRTDNVAAQKLYEKQGFETINVRKKYYSPDGMDANIMRKKLDPITTEVATEDVPQKIRPLVLAIESSCDETGVGIVRGRKLLANVVASSMEEHAVYGGVVPEIAARAHVEAIDGVIAQALSDAGVSMDEIDAFGVTAGPGLSGALMVGVAAAKGLALAAKKPLYAVNHLVGHVAVDYLEDTRNDGVKTDTSKMDMSKMDTAKTVALLVSGGHTEILLVNDLAQDIQLLGETIDDAAGEAFDKVARMLGLGYPGGPAVSSAAKTGNSKAIAFPRALTLPKDQAKHAYNFSFSGLKTAVSRYLKLVESQGSSVNIPDVAASFQAAVVDVLVSKTLSAAQEHGATRILLGGGVAANTALRAELTAQAEALNMTVRIPPLELCTDNGAMIAALTSILMQSGAAASEQDFGVQPTASAEQIQF